ncbi:DUF2304 family protein [Neolewinella sp.]|uniref:DUF2304 family protein n=1 Tax=Neolewinella sp. TaxID=2993543 RepID=UPI003B521ADA
MTPIQLLLFAALGAIALIYLKLVRYQSGAVGVLLLVLLAGSVAVYDPDLTTLVANKLGVERGTDLLLYTTVIFLCGIFAVVYGRFRMIEEQHTRLFREISLLQEQLRRGGENT